MQHLFGHGDVGFALVEHRHGGLADDLGNRAFERADAGFACVALNQAAHHAVADFHRPGIKTVFFHLLGQKVALGDLQLLLLRV